MLEEMWLSVAAVWDGERNFADELRCSRCKIKAAWLRRENSLASHSRNNFLFVTEIGWEGCCSPVWRSLNGETSQVPK
jgi:hypothetical protein